MKIRNGFVSNSSSSSFICEVSGVSESGWDASRKDLGFVVCVNGHTFLEEYAIDISDREIFEAKKAALLKKFLSVIRINEKALEDKSYSEEMHKWREDYIAHIKEKYTVVEQINYGDDDFEDTLDEYYNDVFDELEVPENRCPLCMFTEVNPETFFKFYLKENNLTKSDVALMLKERFKTWENFRKYMASNEDE